MPDCRALAWILALVLPFQALTAVYLDVRGPAHFHAYKDNNRHEHSHGRDHVEHHHHHPHDHSVVAVHEHGLPDSPALEEETRSGWSGTMVAALTGSNVSPQLPELSNSVTPTQLLPLQTRFPGRLERPPRLNQI